MALTEDQSERRSALIDNSLYTGRAYTRVYRCPVLSLDTDLATLTLGRVLPVAEGGPGTSNVGDARLVFPLKFREKGTGAQVTIEATYIKIDVSGTASEAYNETTKGREPQDSQFETTMRVIGIAAATNSAGIPVIGETDAAATPTALTDYVCRSVQIVEKWSAGRVLVISEYSKKKAASTTYT